MKFKSKFKSVLKWLSLALFLGSGAYAAVYVPVAVENFLPSVNTVYPEKAEYCRTVQGSGLVLSLENGWLAQVSVNESDIRLVEKGQKAVLNGAAFDDGAYTAKVLSIADSAMQVMSANGLTVETVVEVTLKIENPDKNLRSGYTAQAVINVDEPREVIIIPYEVICQDDEGEFVYILNGNTAVRKNIITGAELSEGTELVAGLFETDEIITATENITGSMLVKKEKTLINGGA